MEENKKEIVEDYKNNPKDYKHAKQNDDGTFKFTCLKCETQTGFEDEECTSCGNIFKPQIVSQL